MGIQIDDETKSTTIYTAVPSIFYKYRESEEEGYMLEYHTEGDKAFAIEKSVSERRRLQGSISGGINNSGAGWNGNISGTQNFGGGWSGTAGGSYHESGNWSANAGVGWKG